jgi:hypothetical protein
MQTLWICITFHFHINLHQQMPTEECLQVLRWSKARGKNTSAQEGFSLKIAFLLPERTMRACSYRTGMDPDLEAANVGSTQNWASVVTVLRHIYKDICAPLLLWLYFAGWFKPVLCWSWFSRGTLSPGSYFLFFVLMNPPFWCWGHVLDF